MKTGYQFQKYEKHGHRRTITNKATHGVKLSFLIRVRDTFCGHSALTAIVLNGATPYLRAALPVNKARAARRALANGTLDSYCRANCKEV